MRFADNVGGRDVIHLLKCAICLTNTLCFIKNTPFLSSPEDYIKIRVNILMFYSR